MRAPTSIVCRQTAGLLPWFSNGTLDAAEARRVRDHLASCSDCALQLEECLQLVTTLDQHVPSSQLVDFALERDRDRSELTSAEIEQHLAVCWECAEHVALIRATESSETSSTEELPPGTVIELHSRRAPREHRRSQGLSALLAAAALIGAVLGGILVLDHPRSTDPAVGAAAVLEEKASEPAQPTVLLSDGFESGATLSWSRVEGLASAAEEPGAPWQRPRT